MSKQKPFSGQMTIWGPSHNDNPQTVHTLLVPSGFASGPGSWARAWTRVRSRCRLGPGVRSSYFFFGVMGWRGRVDLFPWRCRFGAGARSPSRLSTGPVSVPEKIAHLPLVNYDSSLAFHSYIQLDNTFHPHGSCFVLLGTSAHGTLNNCHGQSTFTSHH